MLKCAGRFILYTIKTPYSKRFTPPCDLVSLLISRGLKVKNENKATAYIANIGYYRLSSYCYPLLQFPKAEHAYKKGATFDLVLNMYRFDRKLRILLFNEIEKIEVAIRSIMLNVITEELNDVFWITKSQNFHNQATFTKTTNLIQSEKEKTKEEFIAHFCSKYSDNFLPVWMIAEIIPFGVLSGIFNNLKSAKLKKKVATRFGLSASVFASWIIALVNLRNLCCHHSRTWNREIAVVPVEPNSPVFPWINSTKTDAKRVYYRICIIKYLLFTVSPNNRFALKLKSLLAEYPTIDIRAMSFPADWENEPLWKA
jgi:abortive infection bacteriophage resistance protein